MPDPAGNREWLDAEELESGAPGLPRPDLNPLVNPLLGENMGRWAQVYFTSPPAQREQAVEKLLEKLKAESGNKKTPRSETTQLPEVAPSANVRFTPNIPKSRPELEFPELPMQGSPMDERELRPTIVPDLVVCPACLHKNPAEQRFCGLCGKALNRELAERDNRPGLPSTRAATHAENAEADWQWLREKSLSSYDVESGTGSRSRILLLALVLVVIAFGAYFFWQNRSRFAHEAAPPSSAPSSEPTTGPSMNVPTPSVPSSPTVRQSLEAKVERNAPSGKTGAKSPGRETGSPNPDTSGTLAAQDGQDDLDRARQYLAGEGVPKNSWMASQLLWKAIGKENSEAVLLLSDLYARGDGVPRSCEQARILLVSAAKKGSSAAAQKLRSIETSCR